MPKLLINDKNMWKITTKKIKTTGVHCDKTSKKMTTTRQIFKQCIFAGICEKIRKQ